MEIEYTQAQKVINNTKTVGLASVITDGGYIVIIVDVIVHPEFQGLGIGTRLMNQVMEFIYGNLEKNQNVFVNLIAAKEKEHFYEKFGFIARPTAELGAGMTK